MQANNDYFCVVINDCYGGFSDPDDFVCPYHENHYNFNHRKARSCPKLVDFIQKCEDQTWVGHGTKLIIKEVSIKFKNSKAWGINEYDGMEHVWINEKNLSIEVISNEILNTDEEHEDLKQKVKDWKKLLNHYDIKKNSYLVKTTELLIKNK